MFATQPVSSTTARDALYQQFRSKISLNPDLNRQLVSYQADKETPFYRWFKYREGFTSRLVTYLLEKVHSEPGMLLDPFAGSGAALFASEALGWQSCGIEVLPVGIHAMEARKAAGKADPSLFADNVEELKKLDFAAFYSDEYKLEHIPITRDAFPAKTEEELVGYITNGASLIRGYFPLGTEKQLQNGLCSPLWLKTGVSHTAAICQVEQKVRETAHFTL